MTTEATAAELALAAQGVKTADLNDGQTNAGAPKPPAAPDPGPTAEQHAANKAKAVEDEKARVAEALAAAERAKSGEDDGKAADKKPLTETDEEKATREAAEKAAKEDTSWQDNYMEFDDPSANAVVELLKDGGVTVVEANAIFSEAIKTGDLTKIDWPTLEKKLGTAKALLARNGIEKYNADVLAVSNAIVDDTYKQVNGKDNWVIIRDWAQTAEKKDPSLKPKIDSYRAMIDLGGESRRLAVEQLKGLYDADPLTKGLGTAKFTTGDSKAADLGAPLSRKDYNALLHKAHADRVPAHVIKALDARRRAGRAAGI